ncbi:MAG TPA: ABC transporter ATP-binding protein, partial [Cyanobacteria bacterium UBA8543]|nr:ABC transporter ATP-binding protein [Cyanobacteria bacterium UBA8543]
MQTVNLTPLQALFKSVLLVAQAAPIELRNLVLLNLLTGASPATLLFFGKVVIDQTSLLLKQEVSTNIVDTVFSHPILLWSMIAIICINLLLGALYTFTVFVVSKLEDRIEGSVQGRVLHKIATFDDIALFENPQLLNIVQLAEKSI